MTKDLYSIYNHDEHRLVRCFNSMESLLEWMNKHMTEKQKASSKIYQTDTLMKMLSNSIS